MDSKLKLIPLEAMQELRGQRKYIYKRMNAVVDVDPEPKPLAMPDYYHVTYKVEWQLRTTVKDDPEAFKYAHAVSTQACMKDFYGPIYDELLEIYLAFQAEGWDFDDNGMVMLQNLMQELRP